MQIHLSDITDSEGKHIQLQLDLDLDKISFQMGVIRFWRKHQ